MPYEQKDNTGSLWNEPTRRTSKAGNEYDAYSGSARINGVDYWINAILKTVKTKNGDKQLFDIQFKEKQPRQDSASNFGQASDNYPF